MTKIDASSVSLTEEESRISEEFVAARQNAIPLPVFPGPLPQTTAAAYAIQMASIAKWPDDVVGWKVGGIPENFQAKYGEERLVGPIFSRSVRELTDGEVAFMPVIPGGFAAVEAEYLIKVKQAVEPGARATDLESLMDLVDCLHLGVEIASSPFADINKLGPCSIITDFGNNAGLVIGKRIEDWQSYPSSAFCARVTIDGSEVGNATGAASIEQGPLAALAFVLNQFAHRGMTLEQGVWISSGAVSGVHEINIGSCSVAEFGEFGSIEVEILKAQPMTR
ncbi:MAG: 2-keto-4-pentenoate hydratase [Alphaproteobacteria bacterium]|nr:MAG: 2-keto-4-pentenoate hydratase [Alphaproteobacteria bacterium]